MGLHSLVGLVIFLIFFSFLIRIYVSNLIVSKLEFLIYFILKVEKKQNLMINEKQ